MGRPKSTLGPPPLQRCTSYAAVLEFLESTRVGRLPCRILLAGGPDVDEDELEKVELWAPEGDEGSGISESSEEEDGPGPPL